MTDEKDIELTRVERAILANQFRVLAAMYPEEKSDYEEREEVMRDGLTGSYEWALEYVCPDSNAMPREICDEVVDILQMHRTLLVSYKQLSDKTGISKKMLAFEGFDANEETKYYSYAEFFLRHDGGQFKELWSKKMGINSHWPKLSGYRAMLAIWRKQEHWHDPLNKQQILDMLEAKRRS